MAKVTMIVKAEYTDKDHIWIDKTQFISLGRVNKMIWEHRERVAEEYKRKKGTWIKSELGYYCSQCNVGSDFYKDYTEVIKFCPFCGAEMENGHDRCN